MMRKIVLMAVISFLSVIIDTPAMVFAQELSREEMMDREMACISERMKTQEALSWQDVCYTNSARQQPVDYFPEDELASYEESEIYVEGKRYQKSLTNFEIGGEVSAITYEEPNFMKEKGEMFGVFAALTHRISLNEHIYKIQDIFSDENKINMFRIEGKISGGEVDYESQGTGAIKGIDDYMIEGRALAGYDIPVFMDSRITPYLGVGYRYLNDGLGGHVSTTGALGYEREAHYVYLPIGFETNFPMSSGWSFGTTFEYDIFLGGRQKSHLEDVSSSYETLTNDQSSGYGLRGSFRITKVNDGMDIFLEPFVRYWHIDDSDISPTIFSGTIVGYGLEPENKSTEYGVKLGLHF
jgi:hypothetical protein